MIADVYGVVAAQTLALILACWVLWLGWRNLRFAPRPIFTIATFGFLIRLACSEAMFWISWLHLPIARSLQRGNGFWFYAPDGQGYVATAVFYESRGLSAIVHLAGSNTPSPFFTQTLAFLIRFFGAVPSVGILLNSACYLMMAAILAGLARRDDRLRGPAIVALLAISFAPGSLVWSLQPLKDTLFSFLIMAFMGLLVVWQNQWLRPGRGTVLARRALATAAAMFVVVYGISSIRWYVAASLLFGLPFLSLALFFTTRRHRYAAAMAGGALLVALAAAMYPGAANYLPKLRRQVRSAGVVAYMEHTREGFDLTPGDTAIAAGRLLKPAGRPPHQWKISAKPGTAEAAMQAAGAAQAARLPASRTGRAIAGIAATFVPRVIDEAIGIISVRGGHGLWLLVEADTLMLDIVLVLVAVACVRLLRQGCASPALVAALVSWVVLSGAIVYSVSNFGTLFRLREMIFLELCMLPLVMVRVADEDEVTETALSPIEPLAVKPVAAEG